MKEETKEVITSLRNATLVFLVRRDGEQIQEVCLAMKKRGFGKNRWNGVGGKVGDKVEETIEEAAKREAMEEIGVGVNGLEKVAELTFIFPHNPDWDQLVHVYFVGNWTGSSVESEEMRPAWFSVNDIPYGSMWLDDELWLPKVLLGKKIQGNFSFAEGDVIENHEINFVEGFFGK